MEEFLTTKYTKYTKMILTQRSSLSAVALAKAEEAKAAEKVVGRDRSIAPHADIKRVKLGEVCEISRKEFLCDDVNVWLLNLDMIEQQTGRVIERVVIPRNDIGQSTVTFDAKCVLYSKLRPNLNKVVLPETEGFATSELLPLVPISEMATREYIAAFLRSATFVRYATSKSYGAKMPRLGTKDLLAAELPLPPLSEQRRIAAVLDKISEMKRNVEARLKKLDLLVKARFNEMFGDAVATMTKWELTKVGDVASVCVGVVIRPTQYYCEGGIRAFRSLNIGVMSIKSSEWVFFTSEGHRKNQKSIVREGDVIVVRSGAPGTACVVPKKYDGCNAVDIIIAHPDKTKVNPVYLAMFTNMPHGKRQIENRIGGAAQQHFNVSGYKAVSIPLPPLPLQRQFAAFVEKVEALKAAAKAELEKVDLLYRAKLQEYFG